MNQDIAHMTLSLMIFIEKQTAIYINKVKNSISKLAYQSIIFTSGKLEVQMKPEMKIINAHTVT